VKWCNSGCSVKWCNSGCSVKWCNSGCSVKWCNSGCSVKWCNPESFGSGQELEASACENGIATFGSIKAEIFFIN